MRKKTANPKTPMNNIGGRYLLYQKTIGALCATDHKWVQQEQVMQGKLIVYERDRNDSRPSNSED